MGNPKTEKMADGRVKHFSVGAIIRRDIYFLLIERANPPLGFAGIAGHVDEGEEWVAALKREVFEESMLEAADACLIAEKIIPGNICRRGVKVHHWRLYECDAQGEIKQNKKETKSIGWYSPGVIKNLSRMGMLEPVWRYWFKRIGIL